MKKLLFFTIELGFNLEDTTEESGIWYIRTYEAYFDEVYYVLLSGESSEPIKRGNTTLICAGSGNKKRDLLLAPINLLKIARQVRPTAYLTVEVIFGWWAALLSRFLAPAKIFLFPLVMPEIVYRVTGESLSAKLPIWLERLVIKFNYWFVDYGLTSRGFGAVVDELRTCPILGKKLIVADILPEAIPSPYFLQQVEEIKGRHDLREGGNNSQKFSLIYVGRLNKEKMVDHLIRMMHILKEQFPTHLLIVGDGTEKEELVALADELEVTDKISFVGWVSNGELPAYFARADALVSPLTGGSLREAAIFGLPIIAYDMDWLKTLPEKDTALLLVPEADYQAMAGAVVRLRQDPDLARRLSQNAETLASKLWLPQNLEQSLEKVFGK